MIVVVLALRVVISVMLFCLPFFLFIIASGRAENAMLLIFPFFGAIPAIVGALLLFVPAELLLGRLRRAGWKNLVIPLLGFTLPILFMIAIGSWSDMLEHRFVGGGNVAEGGWLFVWGVLGACWGLVWRTTEWLAAKAGFRHG